MITVTAIVLYVGGFLCACVLGIGILALGRSNSYWDLVGMVGYALTWPLWLAWVLICELSERMITAIYRKKR